MSKIPNSRNYRTTGNAHARTFRHNDFAGRTGNGSPIGQAPASDGGGNLMFWLVLVVLAVWLLCTHPVATIVTALILVAAWASFGSK